MDVLKKEMERKRKQREELLQSSANGGSRFIRQSDVIAREAELLLQKQRALDEERLRKIARVEEKKKEEKLDKDSLNKKEEEGSHHHEVNVNAAKAVLSPVDQSILSNEEGKSEAEVGFNEEESGPERNKSSSPSPQKERSQSAAVLITHFSQDPQLSDEKKVYKFFRCVLDQWAYDLESREEESKTSSRGKADAKTQKQCKDYIRPLFKLCKRNEVPKDILVRLVDIVKCCEEGNFRAANDHYIRAAIGNNCDLFLSSPSFSLYLHE